MAIQDLCATIKQRVATELQGALDSEQRGEILIDALYELSRLVLPALGPPGRSQKYLEEQGAVLDLIRSITIPLIRSASQQRRGVEVLTEIGEGCLDLFLKKTLAVYAQELLVKSCSGASEKTDAVRRYSCWLLGLGATAVLALYLIAQQPARSKAEHVPQVPAQAAAPSLAAAPSGASAPGAHHATASQSAGAGYEGAEERKVAAAEQKNQLPKEEPKGAQVEQITRVKIANNQVLVPVTLKNGGETVRIELVLDTGSTRTAIHEDLAGRLRIDLRLARSSLSEVADGRTISSRIARVDSLGVGPFAMAPLEVELIPYKGGEGAHDGLLGMDFLSKHRYQIDMEHELIRWF